MAKKKKPGKDESLSPEEMAAVLDEALADDDDGDAELDLLIGDDEVSETSSSAAIAAIISSANLPSAPGSGSDTDADVETPDPAADEAGTSVHWEPITDEGEPDLELIETEEPLTDDDRWGPVQDADLPDLAIEATEEVIRDPWGPVDPKADAEAMQAALAVPSPPRLELPPPVSVLLEDSGEHAPPPARPAATAGAEPRLPWRGTAVVQSPTLPDQLYVADVTQETTQLLVAAWELVEEEPGGRRVRVRLTDDGDAIELETTAPHEPRVALEVEVAGHVLEVRAALTVERAERGLRLGRDVLAGRFTVDPSTSNWPKPE